ncbi:MAG: serine/threonine-protein phosphatase [Gammaproteobacteria bacterium]|nr:serine/threonine-protein phosphatase [Gammaproteobacteria bacterium]
MEPIEHQRLRLLFKQSHTASMVAALGAFACSAVFYLATGRPDALVWLAAVWLATAFRIRLYRRMFASDVKRSLEADWLRRNAATAVLVGISWGALPLVSTEGAPGYLRELQTLVPGFVLMAAITSYGVYFSQYLVLWASIGVTTAVTTLYAQGSAAVAQVILLSLFLPVLLLTARRYGSTLETSMQAQFQSKTLVEELTNANNELHHHNAVLAQQQDLIEQEEELAQHVFRQLTLGGDHELPGIHTWNQAMGSLSGDLTQTARGPQGQIYVLLCDFTGHGLPAALGALPASSVFLAMAAKGLPVETIATELNRKLNQLLPTGYFCCAVLLELSVDRREVHIWNGGLPPLLLRRRNAKGFEKINSHSVPLAVMGPEEFSAETVRCALNPGDLLYAYTDGLTEAENVDGEMWGIERLESFLLRDDIDTPKMPALIETVLEHVNLAPASDDVSIVELVAFPESVSQSADAA